MRFPSAALLALLAVEHPTTAFRLPHPLRNTLAFTTHSTTTTTSTLYSSQAGQGWENDAYLEALTNKGNSQQTSEERVAEANDEYYQQVAYREYQRALANGDPDAVPPPRVVPRRMAQANQKFLEGKAASEAAQAKAAAEAESEGQPFLQVHETSASEMTEEEIREIGFRNAAQYNSERTGSGGQPSEQEQVDMRQRMLSKQVPPSTGGGGGGSRLSKQGPPMPTPGAVDENNESSMGGADRMQQLMSSRAAGPGSEQNPMGGSDEDDYEYDEPSTMGNLMTGGESRLQKLMKAGAGPGGTTAPGGGMAYPDVSPAFKGDPGFDDIQVVTVTPEQAAARKVDEDRMREERRSMMRSRMMAPREPEPVQQNLMQEPPQNLMQEPPQNLMQEPPQNLMQQAPPQQPNLMQQQPPPPQQNLMQEPPQNLMQEPPQNLMQAPPPQNLMQAPPSPQQLQQKPPGSSNPNFKYPLAPVAGTTRSKDPDPTSDLGPPVAEAGSSVPPPKRTVEMQNTGDLYLEQLKRDHKIRNVAKREGDAEVANSIMKDPSIGEMKELLVKNPYLAEQWEQDFETAKMDAMPIASMLDKRTEISESEKKQAAPSYKSKLKAAMDRKRGVTPPQPAAPPQPEPVQEAPPIVQAPPSIMQQAPPEVAAPQSIMQQAPPEVAAPQSIMQQAPDVASSTTQQDLANTLREAPVNAAPLPPPPVFGEAPAEDSPEVRSTFRTLQGLIMKHRGGEYFGRGRLRNDMDIARFQDSYEYVLNLMKSEAGVAAAPAAEAVPTVVAPPVDVEPAVKVTQAVPEEGNPQLMRAIACVEDTMRANERSDADLARFEDSYEYILEILRGEVRTSPENPPLAAEYATEVDTDESLMTAMARVESAVRNYRTNPTNVEALSILRTSFQSAADACVVLLNADNAEDMSYDAYSSATPTDVITADIPREGGPRPTFADMLAMADQDDIGYDGSPTGDELEVNQLELDRVEAFSQLSQNTLAPEASIAAPAPVQDVATPVMSTPPVPVQEVVTPVPVPEVVTPAPVPVPEVVTPVAPQIVAEDSENTSTVRKAHDILKAISGDEKFGLRTITPDEAFEASELLRDAREVIMDELLNGPKGGQAASPSAVPAPPVPAAISPSPPNPEEPGSMEPEPPTTPLKTKADFTPDETYGGGSKYAQMLARAKALKKE